MAIAAISGHTGSITFAAGHVVQCYEWTLAPTVGMFETTGHSPASGYKTNAAGIPSWGGSYRCHEVPTAATTVAGFTYSSFVSAWEVRLSCDALPTTKFTDAWVTNIAGLYSASGSIDVWLEDTAAPPLAGVTEAGCVFTVGAGRTYTTDLITGDALDIGISADGSRRNVRIPWVGTGACVAVGTVPDIADTGAATFSIDGTKQYAGTILSTGVTASFNADRTTGEFTVDFVGTGALTPT